MARQASQAVGGYYALPKDHIEPIARLVDVSQVALPGAKFAVCDPCAADGEAILGMIRLWAPKPQQIRNATNRIEPVEVLAYLAELEGERALKLAGQVNRTLGWAAEHERVIRGDAFQVVWEDEYGRSRPGCHILYLNAPYDDDRYTKRLEQRFLMRFTEVLIPGYGVLLFVVPYHALSASAAYLATHYEDIHCRRFMDSAFDEFGQVVVVARRRFHPLDAPDELETVRITAWAASSGPIVPLSEYPQPLITLARSRHVGLPKWQLAPVDLTALRANLKFGTDSSGRGLKKYGLDMRLSDVLGAKPYRLAMPPRPGHIAQALSAGIMNGQVLRPDDLVSGLPNLLAKGVFERELLEVEHKTNKKGETTAIVQIQQPSLRLCALDIEGGTYYDLAPGSVPSGSTNLAEMNVADLLDRYRAAMGQVMQTMCPSIHRIGVESDRLPLPPLGRTPYRAQYEAIFGCLKLLAYGEQPFIIGEVGTGKSTIALSTIAALYSDHLDTLQQALAAQGHPTNLRPVKRALIVCPPHLLDGWKTQVTAVLPGAGLVVVETISDVWRDVEVADKTLPGAGITIYVLNRETAKLGHAVAVGLGPNRTCPRCGQRIYSTDEMILNERARCPHHTTRPAGATGEIARDLARLLVPVLGDTPRVRHLTPERFFRRYAEKAEARFTAIEDKDEQLANRQIAWRRRWRGQAEGFEGSPLYGLVERLVAELRRRWAEKMTAEAATELMTIIGYLVFSAMPESESYLARLIVDLYTMSQDQPYRDGAGNKLREALRTLMLLLPPASPAQTATVDACKAMKLDRAEYYSSWDYDPWKYVTPAIGRLTKEAERARLVAVGELDKAVAEKQRTPIPYGEPQIKVLEDGTLTWENHRPDQSAAAHALDRLSKASTFRSSYICGEPLFGSIPQPRRFSVAKYITRYAQGRFDLLVLDEGHEFAGDGSAQQIAAHRLVEMGLPTLLLTGSLSNGYASGLFRNLWALSRRFRKEFGRNDVRTFVTRYGYRKVLTEPLEDEDPTIRYGGVSDRRETQKLKLIRTLGEAPGVLPLLLLQHLLPTACTIQKGDLDDALPPMRVRTIPIAFDKNNPHDMALYKLGQNLFFEVAEQIGKDAFSELSGKLFGALGQLPYFYDRATADTGNVVEVDGGRAWEVRYPESVGGGLISRVELLDREVLLPKERWLISRLRFELSEDRNVLIFVTHTGEESNLVARLHRIISAHVGEVPLVLAANKVSTRNREAWINSEAIGKNRRIMIANPVSVSTGLNNLRFYATGIHYQNCSTNAIIFRQSNGRLHRIGQEKPVRILVPVYAGTAQVLAQELLDRKVMASEQVDGADVAAALEAAGAGQRNALDTLELGRAIYKMILGQGLKQAA